MNFHILTLFPEMVENGLKTSIIGRAVAGGLLSIEAVNIRDFAFNKHQSVDDYPYGGGAGMLMQAEPVYLAYKDIEERIQKRIQNAKMQNAETEEQDAEVKVQNARIKNSVLSIFLLRGRLLTRKWQKNWQRKKILFCCAGIMKGLMNVFWRRS